MLQFETARPYALMLSRRAPRDDLEWLNQVLLRTHTADQVSLSHSNSVHPCRAQLETVHWSRYTGRPMRDLYVSETQADSQPIDLFDVAFVFAALFTCFLVASLALVAEIIVVFFVLSRTMRAANAHS